MLRRLSGPMNALAACGIARWEEEGVVEIHANAEEAASGGMISISMQVPVRCPSCSEGAQDCGRCANSRVVTGLFTAWIAVPPGVEDGAVLQPSALLKDMTRPISFRVRTSA